MSSKVNWTQTADAALLHAMVWYANTSITKASDQVRDDIVKYIKRKMDDANTPLDAKKIDEHLNKLRVRMKRECGEDSNKYPAAKSGEGPSRKRGRSSKNDNGEDEDGAPPKQPPRKRQKRPLSKHDAPKGDAVKQESSD